MNVEILPLTENDIPGADRVLSLAFGRSSSWAEDLRLYLSLQSDGWRQASCDGRLVGTVGAVDYGPFAWIGLMAVHPEQQHKGIGGLLMADIMSWLEQRGCPLARLDATQAGARLYRKLGFVEAGSTHVYLDPKFEPLPDDTYQVTIARQTDLAETAALNEAVFGTSRRRLLELYLDIFQGRFFVARAKSGELAGYLVAQRSKLGPCICATPLSAEALLRTALSLPYDSPLRLIAPDENPFAVRIFKQLGFVQASPHLHMVKRSDQPVDGVTIPGNRELIYAQASFGLG